MKGLQTTIAEGLFRTVGKIPDWNEPFQVFNYLAMLQHDAAEFTSAIMDLYAIESAFLDVSNQHPNAALGENELTDWFNTMLDRLRAHCAAIGIRYALDHLDKFKAEFCHRDSARENANAIKSIREQIVFELRGRVFLTIPPERAAYFQNANPWPVVGSRFPKASFDIDEAAKCYAVGRTTAAVFHLMKVVEVCVNELAGHFPTVAISPRDTWGQILGKVRTAISTMPTGTTQQLEEKRKFDETAAYLNDVKEAWRNTTMHVEKTYTDTEAKRVFDSVEAFANRLATLI